MCDVVKAHQPDVDPNLFNADPATMFHDASAVKASRAGTQTKAATPFDEHQAHKQIRDFRSAFQNVFSRVTSACDSSQPTRAAASRRLQDFWQAHGNDTFLRESERHVRGLNDRFQTWRTQR